MAPLRFQATKKTNNPAQKVATLIPDLKEKVIDSSESTNNSSVRQKADGQR
ncbi:hypothetical protein A2U01_0107458, partial [Trifolium medium]|nr:hypothetical protein [Trifolium medium]